jgi:hypothetical protein
VRTLTFVLIRLEVDSGCGSHGGHVPVSEDERPLASTLSATLVHLSHIKCSGIPALYSSRKHQKDQRGWFTTPLSRCVSHDASIGTDGPSRGGRGFPPESAEPGFARGRMTLPGRNGATARARTGCSSHCVGQETVGPCRNWRAAVPAGHRGPGTRDLGRASGLRPPSRASGHRHNDHPRERGWSLVDRRSLHITDRSSSAGPRWWVWPACRGRSALLPTSSCAAPACRWRNRPGCRRCRSCLRWRGRSPW